ncbi:MAG: glycosyltransferase family 4 protein [Verrucomicrobia bacterium]|jgi:glycosyltransferase involved in cell wall biosynthesis|nr:glycosyltransferase family 4 protein [Verrucomicrobiota bacterium]
MRFLMLNWRDPKNPLAGGAERVTEGYWGALRDRGHEVWWFANAFPGAVPTETINGIHIVRAGGKGSSIFEAIRWYRRQPSFDLVVDQHHGLPWFAPWWCGTNCVAYIHEVLGPIWDVFYRWPTSTFGKWQERWTHWLYRNVQFWTAATSTRQALERHGVKRIQQIPYGVHTRAIPELEDKPLTPPVRLIAVSRLAPNKRIEHAIRCLAVLRQRGVDAALTVVGSGISETLLIELTRELELTAHVRFTGALPEAEKDALLRQSHLLLHTSLREGWGLNVIEANALGTPAVVYPVAGLTESTLHDETGVVAAAETPEALADGVVFCLTQPERYARYRRAAWERAKTFHWSRVLPVAADWLESQARGAGRPSASASANVA